MDLIANHLFVELLLESHLLVELLLEPLDTHPPSYGLDSQLALCRALAGESPLCRALAGESPFSRALARAI